MSIFHTSNLRTNPALGRPAGGRNAGYADSAVGKVSYRSVKRSWGHATAWFHGAPTRNPEEKDWLFS